MTDRILEKVSVPDLQLSEPIVLWRKGDGFWLFSYAFSWKTDLWVTLGDFKVKKNAKLGRKICIYLKIKWVETKWSVRQIITIMCAITVQKNFLIRTLLKQLSWLLTKCQIFKKFSQISHFHKYRKFLSIIGKILTNCFYPIDFLAGTRKESDFLKFLTVVSR